MSAYWDKQKESIWNWFRNGSKYSKTELIINWILIFNPIVIFILAFIVIGIRWKYLIGAFQGTYPPFLWCPIWAGVIFAILVLLEIVVVVMKLQQRHRRIKFHGISTVPSSLKDTALGKAIDRKYTTIEDKSGSRKRFD